MNFLNNS